MEHSVDEPYAGLQITTVRPHDAEADPPVRLALMGELDISTSTELDRRLSEISAAGHAVEVDLSGLTFIDSTGLGVLIRWSRAGATEGARVAVRRSELADQVRRLLELTGTESALWP